MSKKDQETIMKVAAGHPKAFHEIYQVGGDEKSLAKFKAAGVKIIPASADSVKRLHAAAETIWKKWAKEQDAAGRPGTKVLDRFVKLTEEYAAKNPYAKK
jgi:TRAP-type C4-dicarboxylate transport system substrate-binding protein